jgi:hypothetical protein
MDLSEQTNMLSYHYNALHKLETDEKEIELCIDQFKNGEFSKLFLCIYEINTESYQPFLRFLLNKHLDDSLDFFYINKFPLILNKKTFSEFLINYLCQLFDHGLLTYNDKHCEFKGLYKHEGQLYFFVDISSMKIKLNDVYKENTFWFCLLDEIYNLRSVCNMKIGLDVYSFFNRNPDFLFIQDSKNDTIDIPMVAYVGREEKLLEFTYMFGISKSEKKEIMGPYYYFTDFKNAIFQGGWSKNRQLEEKNGRIVTDNIYGRYRKGGIIRCAIFTGNMLVRMNYPDDPIDKSDTKKQLLEETNVDRLYECLTQRLSDHDGSWINSYDSVYLGKIELDNGTILRNAPLYVLKNYYQQIPLSYHYINKKTLGEKFDETCDYSIM